VSDLQIREQLPAAESTPHNINTVLGDVRQGIVLRSHHVRTEERPRDMVVFSNIGSGVAGSPDELRRGSRSR
jgi:hypothetical protein